MVSAYNCSPVVNHQCNGVVMTAVVAKAIIHIWSDMVAMYVHVNKEKL